MPACGSLLAWGIGLSSLPGLLQDRANQRLTIDPVSFPLIAVAGLAWCAFGICISDPWPVIANVPSVVSGTFGTCTALRYCGDPVTSQRVELLMVLGIGLFTGMLILTISPLVLDNPAMQQSIAGYICILLCLLQFSLPCVAAVQALKEKDGSLINGPLSVAGMLLNSCDTV